MRDLIGRTLGHYRIVEKIGEGGMGEVYRAHDERLDRNVAVKVLAERVATSEDRVARFEREAKAIAKLSHPNILAIHDFGTEAGPRAKPSMQSLSCSRARACARSSAERGPCRSTKP
jgi:serine/threonine protein kinase